MSRGIPILSMLNPKPMEAATMRIARQLLAVSLLVAIFSSAAGAAGLANVVATPNPAAPNQDVTITTTKTGSQNCGWKVNYGDGSKSDPMGFPNATKSIVHPYASAGTYTILVKGANHGSKPQCNGTATTEIVVKTGTGGGGGVVQVEDVPKNLTQIGKKANIAVLCAKIDCGKLIPLPVIEKRFGFTRPDGVVGWIGKGFGTQAGSVSLRYQSWNGSYKTVNLEVLEWTPTMVGTRIPASLSGFKAHKASVRVKSAMGKESPSYSFDLSPAEAWVELERDDMKVVHCGFDGNADRCNNVHQGNDATFGYFSYTSQGAAIEGFHGNAWGTIGDDTGVDVYEISLANGWTISSASTWKKLSSSNEKVNGPSPGTPAGKTYWKPSYSWTASSGNDTVQYATFIVISGPRGVPFK